MPNSSGMDGTGVGLARLRRRESCRAVFPARGDADFAGRVPERGRAPPRALFQVVDQQVVSLPDFPEALGLLLADLC